MELGVLVDASLATRAQTAWWFKRDKLKAELHALKPAIEKELSEACPSFATCTTDQKADAVAQAVDQVLGVPKSKGPGVSAYALFLGAITANAALTTILVSQLDATTATLTASLLTGITATVVNSLGNPILNRLQSLCEGWSWKKKRAVGGSTTLRNPRESEYEKVAIRSKEDWTPLAQHGRSINRSALTQFLIVLTSATQSAATDEEQGLVHASRLIARLVIDLRNANSETDLSQTEFTDYTYDMFTARFLTGTKWRSFLDDTIKNVKERDPQGDQKLYARILTLWLRPK